MADAKRSTRRVALITGVGPGLGAALARRFSREGYTVGLIARGSEFMGNLANELAAAGALALTADVGQPNELSAAIARVRAELGPIDVFIHNASAAAGNGVGGTTDEQFEQSWRVTTLGGFVGARETAADMIAAGAGVMLFTGATSSVRGGGWLAFSSAKFALRGLVQSLARELWPKGIHVAHVVVDGLIGEAGDVAKTADAQAMLDPEKMADAYWHLAQQDRSAWTLELDLRPNGEEFFV
ncbi:MAG: SDR family NAD(P)-dependent oxidoreductase [Verrucomicrobiota bacterium]|nr:SDR family NAD(P)-dependent oxidoreductase [Verrucomicrobiota bacterium]